MNEEHHHGHSASTHHHDADAFRLSLAILVNVAFVAAEFAAGVHWRSSGLTADAGHNLGDVGGLAVSLLAVLMTRLPPTKRFSYGFHKGTVLASLLNAAMLLAAVAFIVTECVEKLIHPVTPPGLPIIVVAAIGIFVNGGTAILLEHSHRHDLNMKGAYLHMLADTLVSVGVVVSGALILLTRWQWLDPIIGLVIAAIILVSSTGLLKESVILSLDGVPAGIDLANVNRQLAGIDGIRNIHHLHVWPIGTTRIALTAHVVITDESRRATILEMVNERLQDLGILHSTLEFETSGTPCRCAAQRECFE
jgi:cobalt-zinc-cadmium efflux system protein